MYAAGSVGSAKPIRIISGNLTTLTAAYSIGFLTKGDIMKRVRIALVCISLPVVATAWGSGRAYVPYSSRLVKRVR